MPRALVRELVKDHQRPGAPVALAEREARGLPILPQDLVAVAVPLKEPFRVLNLAGGLTMSRLKNFPLSK
jgi:hypothetical protein